MLKTILIVTLSACAIGSPAEPRGAPYVRGPVESVTHHATASAILVQAGPDSREACGIAASLDRHTGYFRRQPSGELARAKLSELQVGDTVEVYVTGPVAESCPVQGYASALVLVSGPTSN